ncbi:MAG: FGGY-family carbohydrate kinase [Moorellaceae bacterium]
MAGKTAVLGIDVGTQGVKVGLFTAQGNCVATGRAEYETFYPQPGWAEQDANDWWKATKQAVKACLDSNPNLSIEGICLCATSSTVVCVDREGTPLAPAIMWMDTRAVQEAQQVTQTNHPVLRYSGGEVSPEWMLPKTLWIKKNNPQLYRRSYKIVEQLDWLNYLLTGKWVASQCNATCKWNYSSMDGGWQEDFYREAGLEDYEDIWPTEVIPMGGKIGSLTPTAASELGLREGIPVFQGGIDAYTGMLGMGVVEEGLIAIVMGTSFVHLALSSRPIFQEGMWGPYPAAILPGQWVLEGGQTSGASVANWVVAETVREFNEDPGKAHALLINEAARLKPGSEGVISIDMWQGNRTPFRDPLISGVIAGLTLKAQRVHLYRSILESVAYGTKAVVDVFIRNGYPLRGIIACGGPTRNKLWVQIIADVLQIPLQIPEFSEAGILGCAILVSSGLGWFRTIKEAAKAFVKVSSTIQPDRDVADEYTFYYHCYLDLYHAVKPILHRIYHHRAQPEEVFPCKKDISWK